MGQQRIQDKPLITKRAITLPAIKGLHNLQTNITYNNACSVFEQKQQLTP